MYDITHRDFTITITQDELAESPREWDNLGTMICWHSRYTLGDTHTYEDAQAFMEEHNTTDNFILPLYLYDHSSLRMRSSSFQGLLPQGHAEFDSGLVGFIYCSKEKAEKEFPTYKNWKRLKAQVYKILEAEVEAYDQYLSGDVWFYSITDKYGEHIESLSGIYGYNEAENEAKKIVNNYIKHYKPKARDKSILGRAHV